MQYGIEIPDEAQEIYSKLYAVNSTWHPHELAREASRERADELLGGLVEEIMVDMFTGILWVLPASVCTPHNLFFTSSLTSRDASSSCVR
jgi:hypothetical protein